MTVGCVECGSENRIYNKFRLFLCIYHLCVVYLVSCMRLQCAFWRLRLNHSMPPLLPPPLKKRLQEQQLAKMRELRCDHKPINLFPTLLQSHRDTITDFAKMMEVCERKVTIFLKPSYQRRTCRFALTSFPIPLTSILVSTKTPPFLSPDLIASVC